MIPVARSGLRIFSHAVYRFHKNSRWASHDVLLLKLVIVRLKNRNTLPLQATAFRTTGVRFLSSIPALQCVHCAASRIFLAVQSQEQERLS